MVASLLVVQAAQEDSRAAAGEGVPRASHQVSAFSQSISRYKFFDFCADIWWKYQIRNAEDQINDFPYIFYLFIAFFPCV